MAILESKYDSLHPDVAHCVTGLAALLQEQGQLVEASNLYERALNMKRKVRTMSVVLGPNSWDTHIYTHTRAHARTRGIDTKLFGA